MIFIVYTIIFSSLSLSCYLFIHIKLTTYCFIVMLRLVNCLSFFLLFYYFKFLSHFILKQKWYSKKRAQKNKDLFGPKQLKGYPENKYSVFFVHLDFFLYTTDMALCLVSISTQVYRILSLALSFSHKQDFLNTKKRNLNPNSKCL